MSQESRLYRVLLLNVSMIAGLVIVGLSSHSLGVLAAGADFAADSIAIGLGIMAIRFSHHPHGHPKATSIVALINSVILLIVTASVLFGGINRLRTNTPHIEGLSVLVVSVVAAIVMVISALILGRDAGKEDLHMRSVLLDTIADGASATAVAVTGGIIFITGRFFWIDSLVSVIIGLIVGYNAVKLLKDVIRSLSQRNPVKLS